MLRTLVRGVGERPWLGLVAALVVELVVFFVGQGDFVASDPLWYAGIAHRISVDPADVFATHDTYPFIMRIGLTVPLAMLYRVFGVSPLVSNVPCLVATLGVVLVVYAAGPTPRARWLGMLFCVTCVPLLRNMAVLNVDLPCGALMACSTLGLSWRERPRGALWLTGAVVAWVMASCGYMRSAAICAVPGSGPPRVGLRPPSLWERCSRSATSCCARSSGVTPGHGSTVSRR